MSRAGLSVSILFLAVSLMSCIPSAAIAADDTADVKQLLGRYADALVRGNVAELNTIWSDDFTYVHTSGALETKAVFLDALKSGKRSFPTFSLEDTAIRIYNDSAVVNGRFINNNRHIRFIAVCMRRGGRWQMVAWQGSGPIPDAPAGGTPAQ